MDPLVLYLIFIFSTSALIAFLLPWLERRDARARLIAAERKLQYKMLFAPEADDEWDTHENHERECRWLRTEMQSIIDRHGIHPLDSIKPF